MRLSASSLLLAALAAGGLAGCTPPPPPEPVVVAAPVPPKPEPPTQNAPMCVRTAEKAAFDVSVLKSNLVVIAVSCKSEERYNAFIRQFQPYLASNEKTLNGYFSRAYGKRAQAQQDDYVTSMANAQSQFGVRSGSLFCPQNLGLFDEVMAIKTGAELPGFAASKPIQQALAVQECPAAPPPAAKKKP